MSLKLFLLFLRLNTSSMKSLICVCRLYKNTSFYEKLQVYITAFGEVFDWKFT